MTSSHRRFISRSYGSLDTTEGDPMLKTALVLAAVALAVSLLRTASRGAAQEASVPV
jgi:hypothetical protein